MPILKSKKTKNKRILVAMSGGVDSSVAAALLVQKGYDVIGAFMHFWFDPKSQDPENPAHLVSDKENKCCSLASLAAARKVARALAIPLYTLNFQKEFKSQVVDPYLRAVQAGLTPNPCITCNEKIKFGLLFEKARQLKADFIATGHYARIKKLRREDQITPTLLAAADPLKDQSYFLYHLDEAKLSKIKFPIGHLTKNKVRALARELGFANAEKKDSQGTCFYPEREPAAFLRRHVKTKSGPIILAGQTIGRHDGAQLYTIGQRHGLDLSHAGQALYVTDINASKNSVHVTTDPNDPALSANHLVVKDFSLYTDPSNLPKKLSLRIRHGHPKTPCKITRLSATQAELKLAHPARAITPGQAAVLYSGPRVLGGGIIAKNLSSCESPPKLLKLSQDQTNKSPCLTTSNKCKPPSRPN